MADEEDPLALFLELQKSLPPAPLSDAEKAATADNAAATRLQRNFRRRNAPKGPTWTEMIVQVEQRAIWGHLITPPSQL